MSKADTPTEDEEVEHVKAATVYEGDRVFMGVNFHGTDNAREQEYNTSIHQGGVYGTVVETPREEYREMLANGERIMADFVVETDDGNRFRWQIDNGYVTGHHTGLGRRTDLGKFAGFYK